MQNNMKHYSQEHDEQLMMPHATAFQAQLCNQTHKAWHYIDNILNKLLKYLIYVNIHVTMNLSRVNISELKTGIGKNDQHFSQQRASHSKISNACLLATSMSKI